MEMKSNERQNQNAHCTGAWAHWAHCVRNKSAWRNFYLFSVSILLRFSCTEINKCTHTHSGYRSKCDLRAMARERVRVRGDKPKKMEKKSTNEKNRGRPANHKNHNVLGLVVVAAAAVASAAALMVRLPQERYELRENKYMSSFPLRSSMQFVDQM